MRYKIILSYDGSAFSGWQIQRNAPSVQGTLEDALRTLLGAGRRHPSSGSGIVAAVSSECLSSGAALPEGALSKESDIVGSVTGAALPGGALFKGSDIVGSVTGAALPEGALSKESDIVGPVTGAGRTDAGVNARNYVAHFDSSVPFDPEQICYKLNAILPREIAVHSISPVPDDFHARFSAKSREYQYFIHSSKDPFLRRYSWYCRYPLDIERMNLACNYLLGVHDCSCFEKTGSSNATSICEIFYAGWERRGGQPGSGFQPVDGMAVGGQMVIGAQSVNGMAVGGQLVIGAQSVNGMAVGGQMVIGAQPVDGMAVGGQLVFTIRANRFLRNMVRATVGTMVDIGRGAREPEYILELFQSGNRSDAGASVPGNALFLTEIRY